MTSITLYNFLECIQIIFVSKIKPTEVRACNVRNQLIHSVVLKCKCGMQFKNNVEMEEHKKDCIGERDGNLMTVHEQLQLDLDSSQIPAPVEQATSRYPQDDDFECDASDWEERSTIE